jgi:hypothetical protein
VERITFIALNSERADVFRKKVPIKISRMHGYSNQGSGTGWEEKESLMPKKRRRMKNPI